ncbi:MAG: tRNA (5-methylaminomethyl-2-thiouridine)(34)-methyltransferase MnmD [bacterium]|nr:tRNA (5-methylaminomethyl-2-thiouridine)(34)-methyltransferase MnmD [bacterium]
MSSIKHHITKDGSSTLYSGVFEQYYHNPNGAVCESRHVFFETPRLVDQLQTADTQLSIFEMGFGTGLNFLLLLDYCSKLKVSKPIHFYSVEAFPVSTETIDATNYEEILGDKAYKSFLKTLFSSLQKGWNTFSINTHPTIELHLFYGLFDELSAPENKIDFFFHDPFSPEVNDELWTVETFIKLKAMANENSVLSTYCAASKARAALAKAGWNIARAKGALGKREMTIASLNQEKLSGFKRLNESRLIERLDGGDFD